MTDPTRRDFLSVPLASAASAVTLTPDAQAQPADVPAWVKGVTRMTFTGDVAGAGTVGAQVAHTNLVWPYFPLRKNGGGLSISNAEKMRAMMATARKNGVRVGLGLPPFPSVSHVEMHPDWRVHPDDTGGVLKLKPVEDNLGTRLGCNLGPWGDYLVELCGELVEDFGVDSFSFDGNYHPAICYCPACKKAYRAEKQRDIPAQVNLDDVPYREYLVWRGDKLVEHYRKLRDRIRRANPDAAVMTWTVNAGRYGHFLHSPRAMPTKLNTVLDGAMQEWWLDETNFGGSIAPAFGAAYLRCVMGNNLAAAEPYLMSRGNPYGTDSFPAHERLTRTLLAVANGCVAAESLGWAGHKDSAKASLDEVKRREPWITNTRPLPWAAQLVSEQTRQFYAYKDIADRFLPHALGAFRCSAEEHLVSALVNDWDLTPAALSKFAVLVLPNAAALSNEQAEAVREFVRNGGGLVASAETSLCDEIGRPRADFALADVFGLRYAGRPKAPLKRPDLDPNFAVGIDADYWKQRTGVAALMWTDHAITTDDRLKKLVPTKSVTFRGPLVKVAGVEKDCTVPVTMRPEGMKEALPAVVTRTFGKGKVVYLAAALDAALWSYAYPYQRVLLASAVRWAARTPPPVVVTAPMCVQSTCFTQGKRTIVHLFNGVNTAANHGLPSAEVPLREETLPIHGIAVTLRGEFAGVRCEPGNRPAKVTREGGHTRVELPPLDLHAMVAAE